MKLTDIQGTAGKREVTIVVREEVGEAARRQLHRHQQQQQRHHAGVRLPNSTAFSAVIRYDCVLEQLRWRHVIGL